MDVPNGETENRFRELAERYDRDVTDIFAIQDEISEAIDMQNVALDERLSNQFGFWKCELKNPHVLTMTPTFVLSHSSPSSSTGLKQIKGDLVTLSFTGWMLFTSICQRVQPSRM